jgi:predicted permease
MPGWKPEIARRLSPLKLHPAREAEITEELAQHLDDPFQELLSAGATEEQAHRTALAELSDEDLLAKSLRQVEQESPQEPVFLGADWGHNFLSSLWQDVRYGLRQLRRNPGFAVVAVVTLALGIGANTAIFSIIDAILFRTLPVPQPQQLVVFGWSAHAYGNFDGMSAYGNCPFASKGPHGCTFSYPLFERLRAEQTVFSGVSALLPGGPYEATIDGHPSTVSAQFVSGNFFRTLQTRAALGRTLRPADDSLGAPSVAVLSYGYWQSRFGGSRAVVGKTIDIHRFPFTIVGVAPQRFTGLDPYTAPDIWVPLSCRFAIDSGFSKRKLTDRGDIWLEMFARLRPGVSLARAQAVASAVFARDVTTGSGAVFKPKDDPRLRLASIAAGLSPLWRVYSQSLLLLMILTGIVLLLACANVAGLTVARWASRHKEVAIRLALGTGRWRLVRQFLTEGTLLAGIGGVLGVFLAFWGSESIIGFLQQYGLPRQFAVLPDPRVLGFTFVVTALVGILAGLAPAIQATRVDVTPALKEAYGAWLSANCRWRRFGLGSLLVVGQVAISVLVLVGAGLLARSLLNRETRHFGFQTSNLLTVDIHPAHWATATIEMGIRGPDLSAAYRQLQDRFSTLPGVASVSYSAWAPMSGGYAMTSYSLPGAALKRGPMDMTGYIGVGPGFFKALRIPIVAGHGLAASDFASTALPEPAVANEAFVKQALGNLYPIGQEVTKLPAPGPRSVRIVGVARNVSFELPPNGRAPMPALYYPLRNGVASFEFRTSADPKTLVPLVRSIVSQANAGLVAGNVVPVSEEIDHFLYKERLVGWLSTLFAALALLLASVGLYGLLAWEVTRRTHELGVRMALGAERASVLRMVLWLGARLILMGTAVGLALALALTRLMRHFLFHLSPTDPVSFAAACLILFLVALLACYIPARRATKVDPIVALRYE